MSDSLRHECGIALVRLTKDLKWYQEKYGTPLHGFNQLFLLMEKQHNRGQDGAGVACVKLEMPAGVPFMFRERNIKANPLDRIFRTLLDQYQTKVAAGDIHPEFADTVKRNFDFGGELLLAVAVSVPTAQQRSAGEHRNSLVANDGDPVPDGGRRVEALGEHDRLDTLGNSKHQCHAVMQQHSSRTGIAVELEQHPFPVGIPAEAAQRCMRTDHGCDAGTSPVVT